MDPFTRKGHTNCSMIYYKTFESTEPCCWYYSCLNSGNRIMAIASALGLLLLTVIGVAALVHVLMGDSLSPPERARVILSSAPLIDGKNDLAYNIRKLAYNDLRTYDFSTNLSLVSPWNEQKSSQTDLLRLRDGNVGTQVFAARADCDSQYKDAVAITLEQIDVIKRLISNYSTFLMPINNTEDIKKATEESKIGAIISIEGGHSIQSSLGILRQYYDLGVRMMTLAKDCSTPWVDNSRVNHANRSLIVPSYNHGLTIPFGQNIVTEMNRLGMIIDISHASIQSMKDVLDFSKAPIVFSHSAARNICNSERNLDDDILKLVKEKDGLVMITFDARTIACNAENATLHHVIEHIEHIKSVTSVDNIGIGSNFDGMERPVEGLEDVSKFPVLFATLVESGWDYDDLEKLAGKNFLRVFEEVEKVRDSLQDTEPIQGFVNRTHVETHWSKKSCTSKMGLLPPLDPMSMWSFMSSNFSQHPNIDLLNRFGG